jgi:hypothetical protein
LRQRDAPKQEANGNGLRILQHDKQQDRRDGNYAYGLGSHLASSFLRHKVTGILFSRFPYFSYHGFGGFPDGKNFKLADLN